MDDVFTEFYTLEPLLDSKEQHIQNYVIIRLATVIEQFFRKIIEIQIQNNPDLAPSIIEINVPDLDKIRKMPNERVISSNHNFQNAGQIVDTMNEYKISGLFKPKSDMNKEKLTELFELRHDTVHTVLSSPIDVKIYYKITEQLMKITLQKIYTKNDVFYTNKASSLAVLGKHQEAIKNCDKALEHNPNNPTFYTAKAVSLGTIGKHQEAIKNCDKALSLNPNDYAARATKFSSLVILGKHQEAIKNYDKATLPAPNDIVSSTIFNTISNMLTSNSSKATPPTDLDDPEAPIFKAALLAALGKHEKAVESYDKALSINPNDAPTYIYKGFSLAALGKHEKAVESYDKALSLNQSEPMTYILKSISLAALGKHEKASYCKTIAEKLTSNKSPNTKS